MPVLYSRLHMGGASIFSRVSSFLFGTSNDAERYDRRRSPPSRPHSANTCITRKRGANRHSSEPPHRSPCVAHIISEEYGGCQYHFVHTKDGRMRKAEPSGNFAWLLFSDFHLIRPLAKSVQHVQWVQITSPLLGEGIRWFLQLRTWGGFLFCMEYPFILG